MIANDRHINVGVRVLVALFLLTVIGMFVWILLGLLFPGLPIFSR